MKCEFEVTVLSTRPYTYVDKVKGENVEMTEVVYQDEEGNVYKSSKRGVVHVKSGPTVITINIRANQFLKPEVGVIEF